MNNTIRALLVMIGVMLSGSVWAQGNPIKITTCGTASPPAGASNPYMDANGNLCTASGGGGGSVTQGTSPWVDNITQWASGVLGAMANYGTSPGAVLVPGVNAFVTNTVATTGGVNTTPTDCSGTITSGGNAQNAFTAQTTLHGFTIANIDSTAGSGEPLWFSFTTTAAASTAASYPLAAPTATTFANLSSFTAPPGFGLNHALSIIGVTTGHKFSCTWW